MRNSPEERLSQLLSYSVKVIDVSAVSVETNVVPDTENSSHMLLVNENSPQVNHNSYQIDHILRMPVKSPVFLVFHCQT